MGIGAPSSISASASSTGTPMLPATTVERPADLQTAPAIAVTVLLPLEPVTAITFGRVACLRRARPGSA